VIIPINVIKIGSHQTEINFGERNLFLVRTNIKIPDSLVQKWGKEYLSLRNFDINVIEEMMNNDGSRFFTVSADITTDRHGENYIKMEPMIDKDCEYWFTTFTGIDFTIDRNSLIPVNPNSKSRIFTVAFNRDNPKMFEASAILQSGDVIKMGSFRSTFCPFNNPFLKVWNLKPETTFPDI
jgi:hypothetical protein